ncbi:MAG: hypothetical protein SO144_01010 [Campylobacter sp.]|nr:hypothetical protein [Campylobacter sp.]
MNENKMLNDKPIFVAKIRTFHGLIAAATCLMLALVIYFFLQEQELDKPGQVVSWVCAVGIPCIGGVTYLYKTLIFKKIMLFDDRIEIHCLNKVIVRTYSQIKSFKHYENDRYLRGRLAHFLRLECEPKFWHTYLNDTFLHKNELYKIKEILIKKGVKGKG